MSGWGIGWGLQSQNDIIDEIEEILNIPVEEPTSGVAINAIWQAAQASKRLNKHPTHDPYTNPNAHIYYECNCGAILDPGTKSFANLNNHASEQGWKIRFSHDGYIPYCVKCGEDVE